MLWLNQLCIIVSIGRIQTSEVFVAKVAHHTIFFDNFPLDYRGGGLAQWLASRTTDQGSLVRDLDGSPFVVALSKSHLPLA